MIFSIKPQIFELKCVFSYFRLKTHITLLLPVYVHSWEQRKVSELSEKTFGGGTPKTSNDSFWKGNIPWIQSSDLVEGSLFDVEPRKYISQEAVDKSATKLVPEKSVAIVTRVGVGKLAFMPFSYATSQDFLSLSVLKTEPQFTVYALYKKLQSELNDVQGTSIKGVTKDELLAKEVMIPCYKEQEKIGSYLHSLDHLITLHQCKCQIDGCRFQSPLAITWEQRKVTEIGKIYIGLVTTMTKHYTDEGTLLIRNSDIKDGKFEFGDNPIYLEKTFAEKNETRMHQIGDVITVHTGDVGTSAVITENEAKSIGFATIVTRPNPKIIDSNYLCSFLNTDKHKKWAVSISTGDGRTNYNLGDYFELVVPVPSIAEQKKIASYIQKLNRLITLHQREFAFLCKEKSKKFRYIKNAWEQRKVREVTDRYDNLRIPVAASLRVAGTTPYYGANGIQDYVDGYTHDGEFILVAEDGANDLKNYPVKCVKGRIWVNNHAHVLQGKYDCADNQFLAYAISQADIESLLVGGGRAKLNAETLMGIDLLLPNKAEQIRIGKYLAQLDNLITLHRRAYYNKKGGLTNVHNDNQQHYAIL